MACPYTESGLRIPCLLDVQGKPIYPYTSYPDVSNLYCLSISVQLIQAEVISSLQPATKVPNPKVAGFKVIVITSIQKFVVKEAFVEVASLQFVIIVRGSDLTQCLCIGSAFKVTADDRGDYFTRYTVSYPVPGFAEGVFDFLPDGFTMMLGFG